MNRYWCPNPTSCFTFFYFHPYKSVNICPYLSHPYINFKYLSVSRIFNMLSIIVEYHFFIGSTHKPVITSNLWAPLVRNGKKNILIDAHCKTIVRNSWYLSQMSDSFEVPSGCCRKPQEVYHPLHNLSKRNLSGEYPSPGQGFTPVLGVTTSWPFWGYSILTWLGVCYPDLAGVTPSSPGWEGGFTPSWPGQVGTSSQVRMGYAPGQDRIGYPLQRSLGAVAGALPERTVEVLWDGDGVPPGCGLTNKLKI